jgi:phosphoribosylamine-glycine ligase
LKIFQSQPKYTVEHHINGLAEIGMDIPTVNGRYTSHCMAGLEVKDCMYVCKIIPYHSLPFQVRDITDRLAPVFNDMEYSGIFSDEVMIGEDKRGYMLDFTCRFGQPPTSILTSMWKNFSEVVWKIANGMIPEIEYEYEYAVQFVIKSDLAENHPSPVKIPKQYQEFVKIKNLVIDEDGTWYYTPNGMKMKEIGACVGLGNSIDEAFKKATKIADSIEGFDISIKVDAMEKAKKSLDRLKKAGISFI